MSGLFGPYNNKGSSGYAAKPTGQKHNKPVMLKEMIEPLKKKAAPPVKVWGDHNFHFQFKNQGESMYNTSKNLSWIEIDVNS